MSKSVVFFAPDSAIGNLEGWEIQSGSNPSISRQRAQALGANGDEIASAQYGAQIAYSMNYKAKVFEGTLTIPKAGAVVNGTHIDSVELAYSQTDYPSLSVSAHSHAKLDGTPKSHDTCRTYSPSLAFPARAIGIPSALTGAFTCPEGVGIRALSYTLTCNHVDEMDGEGEQLAGDNYDGSETLTIEFTGEVSAAELNIGNGWMLPESEAITRGNTQAHTTSITLTRHIACDQGE